MEYLLTAITVLWWPVSCGEGLGVPCFRTRELVDIWTWFLRKISNHCPFYFTQSDAYQFAPLMDNVANFRKFAASVCEDPVKVQLRNLCGSAVQLLT
jgi:hypothetical protein